MPGIGYLQAYGNFWRYYADFSGRTTKEAFWKAYFVVQLINLALSIPIYPMLLRMMESAKSLVAEAFINMGAGLPSAAPPADLSGFDYGAFAYIMAVGLFSLVTIIPMIALYIRRLHDIDRHGAYFLLFCIPYAGIIIMLIMLTRPSAPYDVHPGQPGGPYPYAPRAPYGQQQVGQPSPYTQRPQYGQPSPYTQQSYGSSGPYTQPPARILLQRPRRFSPYAGGNAAALAIILSIIVYAGTIGYNAWASVHYTEQMMKIIESATEDLNDWSDSDVFDTLPMPDQIPFDPYIPDDEGVELTPEQQAAVDRVKEGTIDGLPEFTIEEVLLSRADEDGLIWDYYDEAADESVEFYVTARGFAPETLEIIYADFSMMSDGRIVVTNIMIGDRDEKDQRAKELYDDWYRNMLTYGGNAKNA
ncbi:MAG: DUF805 domain-containing protein [Clostridiales Family XIII bacterium]|nr:DUF805 domain-containing protein [Clostridiales Family XIII bacterium]